MVKLTAEEIDAQDAARLNELGYKQELKRELTSIGNMGMALSVVCISSGLTSLFAYGLNTGGPVVMVWGWVGVCFFTVPVALAMAEISSAYPTSGGLYYWAAQLSSRKYAPFASWMTGWYNLIGQFAVTAGIDFGIALMIGALINIGTDGAWAPTAGSTVGIHVAICFSHGITNSLGPRVMTTINTMSTVWQVVAPVVILITIACKAPTHQSASFVFGYYNNNTGWTMPGYVILTGLLQAQFTMTGYDASAHLSEETKRANIAAPVGMVMAVLVSAVMGWCFIIGFLFCIQDFEATLQTTTNFPVMQIIFDSVGRSGAIVLMVILILACWFCGFASVTANSRMIYAFSRDGAMPGSQHWHVIHQKTKTPLNAVWLSVLIASLLGLPSLGNSTAFSAITSVATIGLYISYGIPIVCKLLNQKQFTRGPLHLGVLSPVIGSIAVLWIIFITILFVLPPQSPVTPISMNYACLAIGLVTLGAGGRFAIDARVWFKGPITNLDAEFGQKKQVQESVDNHDDIHEKVALEP
ncbi:amino acid/polyamine transporter I [Halteromyces radiatus]|uniref:amino acid/polyamine transporter I n=1 Tax=Halteromyces radiatus TaxID=101107 RepID=UPI0022212323|nr:amino acid/polyamine transporter I [Halteromyces radiatus]KAI8098846.1 amino acid/polyamine transporter I [Halteromyces radiatus]